MSRKRGLLLTAKPQEFSPGTPAEARPGSTVTRMPDLGKRRVTGMRPARPELQDMLNGRQVFGLDVRLPGMKFAAVKHAPVLGARVERMGTAPPGTQAVNLDTAVAVIAGDTWSARKALNELSVDWAPVSFAVLSLVDTATQTSSLASLINSSHAATVEATPEGMSTSSLLRVIASQPLKLNVTYHLPMLAHAPMEVLNCTVDIHCSLDGSSVESVHVWCPAGEREHIARTVTDIIPSLDPSLVAVTATPTGDDHANDVNQACVAQAVRIALVAKAPIQVMWWREENFARDAFRPAAVSKVQVGLDRQGKIKGWYNRVAAPSVLRSKGLVGCNAAPSSFVDPFVTGSAAGTGEAPMPYADAMAHRVVDYVEQKTGFSLGSWRSAGQSISCFAIESAIDECAKLLGEDPCDYRASLLAGNPLMRALLDDVAALSRWSEPPLAGTARGLALSPAPGGNVALVAELRKSRESAGIIQVSRIFCSASCRPAVDPEDATARLQGGILRGLSAARWGKVSFDKGVCQVRNFGQYRLSRLADTPEIIVRLIDNGAAQPGELADLGIPPVAPALANAYAALTGVRKRSLPLEF